MSEKIQKYSPSGKYESIAYAYALGGLVFIVPLTAWLYGFQASRLPNVVNMVIWGVLIYFAPKFIELILKAGKVRSEKMIFWVSAIIVLTFFYLHWAVYASFEAFDGYRTLEMAKENNLSQSFWGRFQLAFQPGLMWEMIKKINSYGPWVVDGEKISGFFVWTSWVIESLGILVVIFTRLAFADENPFSEEDQSWHEKTIYGPIKKIDTEEALKAVANMNSTFFKEIEFTEKGNSDYSQLITYSCLRGQDYLSLQHFVTNVDRGRVNYDEKGGLQLLAIDKSIGAILQKSEAESQEQQAVVTEVGSIDSPVVAEEYKVNESEIIQPQIGFKYNKTFELGSILYALMGFGFGIMLLYTSTLDYMEDKALSLIGGIIFTGVGVASIGAILFSKSVSKNRIVLKVNSSFIEFDPAITGNKKLIIPFNYLKGIEHYRNESGTVGLSFLCKDKEMFGTDLLNMGVSSVDTNSVILANELQKCIGLEADKRQEQIEDWAKRKPSLLV